MSCRFPDIQLPTPCPLAESLAHCEVGPYVLRLREALEQLELEYFLLALGSGIAELSGALRLLAPLCDWLEPCRLGNFSHGLVLDRILSVDGGRLGSSESCP